MDFKIDNIEVERIEEKVEILNVMLLDGGRNSFYCKSGNRKFWIRIVTHGIEEVPYKDGYWPGGMYLNNRLIEFNSNEEIELINVLSRLSLSQEYLSMVPEHSRQDGIKSIFELIQWTLDFVKSDQYIEFAQKTGRTKRTLPN